MRRADRLFQMIEVLRRSDLTTAKELAGELEVSIRTVYRDVADLQASGVRIDGEAGVGYVLREFDLPPMMFDRDEIEALVFGMRMVETWGDSELAAAARRVSAKVKVALPESRQVAAENTQLFAPSRGYGGHVAFDIAPLRHAIRDQCFLLLDYVDAKGGQTQRRIRPLGMVFFGQHWLLLAWCELREDFRAFRPDRIARYRVQPETFESEAGRTLEDYRIRAQEERAASREGSEPPRA